MVSCHAREIERNLKSARVPGYPGTRVRKVPVQTGYPGTRSLILGEYEVLLV